MGDGQNLKKILDERKMSVRAIAKKTKISPTTLYSLIQRDTNLRFDYALRIANELDIDVNDICEASPFSGALKEDEIYPTIPNDIYGLLDENRVKGYLKNSMFPLIR